MSGKGELKKGGRDGGRMGGEEYDPALCCSISFIMESSK